MDESLKSLLSIASGVGLGQIILFWVTRRSRKVDTRDEKELNLETSLLAERRELLAGLRAQLLTEQGRCSRLEIEKAALFGEIFNLQKFANEVLAKYDSLRTLNPAALLPAIRVEPDATAIGSADPVEDSAPPAAPAQPEEGGPA